MNEWTHNPELIIKSNQSTIANHWFFNFLGSFCSAKIQENWELGKEDRPERNQNEKVILAGMQEVVRVSTKP